MPTSSHLPGGTIRNTGLDDAEVPFIGGAPVMARFRDSDDAYILVFTDEVAYAEAKRRWFPSGASVMRVREGDEFVRLLSARGVRIALNPREVEEGRVSYTDVFAGLSERPVFLSAGEVAVGTGDVVACAAGLADGWLLRCACGCVFVEKSSRRLADGTPRCVGCGEPVRRV